jgi:hypothetical protein
MKARVARLSLHCLLIIVVMAVLPSRASGDRLCGAASQQWNEKNENVANIKGAQCTFTTRVNVKVCNGGASTPDSTARLWLGLNADGSQKIRVGYYRGTWRNVIMTSYFYDFSLPGGCRKVEYLIGNPAAGAQPYSIQQVTVMDGGANHQRWRVSYGGTNADSNNDCVTCDGVQVAYGAYVAQRETCCVGSGTDTVQYTNCQRDVGGGMANPAGWAKNLTLPNYPVGAANPAAFVMQNEAANSFTIYDARN